VTEPAWYLDAEQLKEEVVKHGSLAAAARVHGLHESTLQKRWRRLGLGDRSHLKGLNSRMMAAAADDAASSDQWFLDALKRVGDHATVEQLADLADVSPRRVRESLERLTAQGYRIALGQTEARLERDTAATAVRHVARPELFDGDVFRFAIVSDTHLGSIAERPDALATAYEVIAREEIRTVYHAGDLVDGLGVYRTQNTEVRLHTYEQQVDHATDVYPLIDGVTTYIIGGNHDLEGDFGKAGADPVQAVTNRRDDFEYLGRYSARVELPNGAEIHLLHPQGGGSYATSYRAQKIVESYEGGDKPAVTVIGHYHKAGYFPTRGVHTLLAGTFQGPTTFSTRKAMGAAGWGFYLVDCRLADDGSIVRFRPEFCPFYLHR
jgi:predicted phosphodiesterase